MTTYLGVDLGGTQLRMAGVDARGKLATEVYSLPTGRSFRAGDLATGLKTLYDRVRAALGDSYVA